MVRVEHAVFGYGPDVILRDLSFEVAAGEILCLLGPNGSGKTTLFRCLSGSLRLRSGAIWLGGTDVATIKPLALARLLGVVFQEHAPPFPFTVLDVIRMGRAPHLRFFASPSAADTAIAEGIVARLGLTHLAGQPYTLVSGGERQLALIGRALCQEPRILLLDEPTSNLDYRNSMLVVRTVTELARSGLTVIMTTHAPDQALLLDGKVALLRDGSFVAYGAAARELTSGNLQRTYDMDIEVASAYVPRIGRSVRVVVPVVETARPEGPGLSGPARRGDPARCVPHGFRRPGDEVAGYAVGAGLAGQAAEDGAGEQAGDVLDRLRAFGPVPGPGVVAHAEDLERRHHRVVGAEHPRVRAVAEDAADDRHVAGPLLPDVPGEVAVEVADEFPQARQARGAVVAVRGEQGVDHRHEPAHRVPELGQDVVRLGEPAGEVGDVQLPEQGFLAAEVVDDGALAQVELGGDVGQAGVRVPAVGDMLGEDAQDRIARTGPRSTCSHLPTISTEGASC